MNRIFVGLLTAVMFSGTALPTVADERPVVVELFTSQGCSSCPPADALLHELADQDDVLALAFHVDYWDYIGWKDIFADPRNADRQRAYAQTGSRSMIYTPQMIINGVDHVVGNSPQDVASIIARHKELPVTVDLDLVRDGEDVVLSAAPQANLASPLLLQLVRYNPKSTVEITRGENAGRSISYANVVTELTQFGVWDGSEALNISVPAPGDAPVVILLQQQNGAGIVEAAAQLK